MDNNGGGVIKIFHRQKICLTVPESFLGNTCELRLRKFLVAKNSVDNNGGHIKNLRGNFSVSLWRKVWQASASLLCFRKFPVAKNSMENKGGIKIFRRKILSYSAENFRRGSLVSCVLESIGSEDFFG